MVIMSNCHRDKRPCAPISFSPLPCYHLGMLKHLLKKEYPSLRKADYEKAVAFIDGKCSQYYFLDYMRTTGGNVDDAIEFYLLDDRLRSLLAQYLIRFEIQLKTDFVSSVQTSTRCSSFWEKRRFYLPDARHPRSRGRASKFFLMKKKILGNISHLRFATPGPSNYLAMYSSSFGTFQELFKLIDGPHKAGFIAKYTSCLSRNDYRSLNAYLEAIRRIRNRCAHGNHVITLKMVNDLNNLRQSISAARPLSVPNHLTVMESVLLFVIAELNCGQEFKSKLLSMLKRHDAIITKYSGRHSLSASTAAKLV